MRGILNESKDYALYRTVRLIMSDDFRPFGFIISVSVLYVGIKFPYIPAIIIGGLGVLGFSIWYIIEIYKIFKDVKKK